MIITRRASGLEPGGSSCRTCSRSRSSSTRSMVAFTAVASRCRAARSAASNHVSGTANVTRIVSGSRARSRDDVDATTTGMASSSAISTSAGALASATRCCRAGRPGSASTAGTGAADANDTETSTTTPFTNDSACRTFTARCRSCAMRRASSGSTSASGSADSGASNGPACTRPLRKSVTATRSGASPAIDAATSTRIACTRAGSSSTSGCVRTLTLAVRAGPAASEPLNEPRSSTS